MGNVWYIMCYVIGILGLGGLVTTSVRTIILAIDPKFGLSILRSISKILEMN